VQEISVTGAVGWFQTRRYVNIAHVVLKNNIWSERVQVHQLVNATRGQQRLIRVQNKKKPLLLVIIL
jgi:hypothetical protein